MVNTFNSIQFRNAFTNSIYHYNVFWLVTVDYKYFITDNMTKCNTCKINKHRTILIVIGIGTTTCLIEKGRHITKSSPCNEDPFTPNSLYSKTGVYKGIHFFLILVKNIDCGYSLEPPH